METVMTLQEQLRQIDQLKAEIEALRPLNVEQEQRIMDQLHLDWTYHSNAIEGNTLSYGETKAFLLYGITAAGKPFRDYLEMRGHHEALHYLRAMIRAEEPLTEAAVRELHKIVLVEPHHIPAQTADGQSTTRLVQPGQYKTAPNRVRTSTGEIHYYATPEETPALMADLLAWYHQEQAQLHPVVLAATFHYRFVVIHPFDDGNGRMARLLMNLLLMQARHLPVIVPLAARNLYLLALGQADADSDLEPFVSLVAAHLLLSQERFLQLFKGEISYDANDWQEGVQRLKERLSEYNE